MCITTYEAFGNAAEHFRKVAKWEYVVLDEAHRLKNPRSKLALALRALSAGGARCTLLAGTAPARNLLGTF